MNPPANPGWDDFQAYCDLRARGLRREALQRLGSFIAGLAGCSYAERKEFVCWLFSDGKDIQSLPHPLRVQIVEPLLAEWIALEPANATPHFWFGDIPHLWEAYRLDLSNPDICWRLIRKVGDGIGYEIHEMPYGFLGDDPEGTLSDLFRLHRALSAVPGSADKIKAAEELEIRIEVVGNFISYLREPNRDATETFAGWCDRLGRRGWAP